MPDITFQGGRAPLDPQKPKLMLAPRLRELAAAPEHIDYVAEIASWPMYGNDRMGDCTIATVGHALQLVTHYGAGAEVVLPEDAVVSKYAELSGYRPEDPSTDTGLVVQEVLNDWRKNGIEGHKALAFAFIQPTDRDTIEQAISLFGWVYLGIDFPAFAMTQFNQGRPWDVETRNTQIEGGHAIPAGAYDISDNMFQIITWGRSQAMTEAFWERYVEECWVVITPEWVNAAGATPTGLDLYGLGEDFASLTGQANPFPEPAPPPAPEPPAPEPEPPTPEPTPEPEPPAPEPTPEPGPAPDPVVSADDEFARALLEWLDRHPHPWFYRKTQRAAVTWLRAKGYISR